MCNNYASDPIERLFLSTIMVVLLSTKCVKTPGRILVNRQLTTYSNTFLLTWNQILQKRTVRNTQLLIKIYDS